jgi:hypothetical protein
MVVLKVRDYCCFNKEVRKYSLNQDLKQWGMQILGEEFPVKSEDIE